MKDIDFLCFVIFSAPNWHIHHSTLPKSCGNGYMCEDCLPAPKNGSFKNGVVSM